MKRAKGDNHIQENDCISEFHMAIEKQISRQMKIQQILEGFSNPPLELISETLDLDI